MRLAIADNWGPHTFLYNIVSRKAAAVAVEENTSEVVVEVVGKAASEEAAAEAAVEVGETERCNLRVA